jgi:hypothetical protein
MRSECPQLISSHQKCAIIALTAETNLYRYVPQGLL